VGGWVLTIYYCVIEKISSRSHFLPPSYKCKTEKTVLLVKTPKRPQLLQKNEILKFQEIKRKILAVKYRSMLDIGTTKINIQV